MAPSRSRTNPRDHGLDNFSFDNAHLQDFVVPDGLIQPLPKALADAVANWVYAGAALRTAIDRLHLLDEHVVERPVDASVSSRSDSLSWEPLTPTAADTPATVTIPSDSSATPLIGPGAIAYPSFPVVNPYTQLPTSMLGMESPPFTPVDSKCPGTPSYSASAAAGPKTVTLPDLHRLNAQLYPLTRHLSPATTVCSSSPDAEIRELKTWEAYVKTYNAEVYDLKYQAVPRFVGCTRTVRKLMVELELCGQMSSRLTAALRAFQAWWAEQSPKAGEYQVKAGAWHEKSLV
ncbi:hypothetical protein BDY17DRAFT_311401 [Neohortaea acidophila]|uniref:Uncharacterized protein n=1 Tax=Neohortaea acidophila TaxID=245834 RepID=A0A6A6PPZ1_9PEZI|nr:uncharacterized protein BDY17DRAFT_311401 [Neohortaea acidophila]KAF2481741.1 hypothetical protein BDY17DRAFT_311401 [Neohortaea acidophila]